MRTGRARLTIVGDLLLDRDLNGRVTRICPDAPVPVVDHVRAHDRPGGAGLAALLAAADGADVTLVSALADDAAGRRGRRMLEAAGVHVVASRRSGATPVKMRVRVEGQSLLRIDLGDATTDGPSRDGPTKGRRAYGRDDRTTSAAIARAIMGAEAVLVADYGGGVTADAEVRDAIVRAGRDRPVVWDPHPRGETPVPGCRVVTPNAAEAAAACSLQTDDPVSAVAAASALAERWSAGAVCVTLGRRGAVLASSRGALLVPAPRVVPRDVCGAGDRFATAVALALADGVDVTDAVERAVDVASRYVSTPNVVGEGDADPDRAAAAFANDDADGPRRGGTSSNEDERSRPHGRRPPDDVLELDAVLGSSPADAGGARGGRRVVATSGCFDLLHAGHVRMLSLARTLGERLVVLLNDDDSVRRRKGAGRPVVPASERAELLLALSCVDEVVIFGEDTPERALASLRPDVYAKGADYRLDELPEAPLIASWGGQTVILPYEAGRSTTELIARSSRSAVGRR